MSENAKICNELVFARGTSRSRQAKVKEFWEFLDSAADKFQPYTIQPDAKKSDGKNASKASLESETRKSKLKRGVWHDELKVFQELGLDKVALASDDTRKHCVTEMKYGCTDFSDTMKQSYKELNEEIKAFEERLERAKTERDSALN